MGNLRQVPGSTTLLIISWQDASAFGGFFFLTLVVVLLVRRIRRINFAIGHMARMSVECGLTDADREAEIMRSLVELRGRTAADEEFRVLAQFLVSNYFANNNAALGRSIWRLKPRKVLQGHVIRDSLSK